jgi:hypothetical protein
MNRNEIIGTAIGKTLGYAVQIVIFSEVAKALTPPGAVLLKASTKYSIKLINYTSKNYIRTDFRSEKVFSDAIDASFFAD